MRRGLRADLSLYQRRVDVAGNRLALQVDALLGSLERGDFRQAYHAVLGGHVKPPVNGDATRPCAEGNIDDSGPHLFRSIEGQCQPRRTES